MVSVPEREDSCEIAWNSPSLTLRDLSEYLSVQLDLYDEVVVPYVTSELYQNGSERSCSFATADFHCAA